ncbi:MAG: VWA domain-containing protein [Acidobacteria bacterium]|nr:VWA domain-containing protein [Acidobacteriota bacterium]MBS1866621.1 VWA domain-containing protein [Acidobacteriota bacterium]
MPRSLAWIVIVALFGVCGSAVECQEGASIRANVNLVSVSFIARDSRGALLDKLTLDDVEVFEDSVPQKISFFAKSSDVPLTLGLIVDASGSQEKFSKKHEKDLEIFLKRVLGPKDRVFLLGFGNHLRLVSDFTQSGDEVIQHLKEYEKSMGRFPEIGPREDRDLGTAFYDSIYYSVVEKLQNEPGRKALLIFSDGEDNSSSTDMMTTLETAQAANVLLYTIRYTETRKNGQLTARNKYGIKVMDRLAKDSGGAHIDARAMDPKEYFQQIADELRTSYTLSYYPTNPMKDQNFRRITVRPKQDGVKIRTKSGYFARSSENTK